MTKRSLYLIPFMFAAATASGQVITRLDADSMLFALQKNELGIERFDLLLSVAQFHIFKPGENRVDFDSADVFLKQAEALSASLKSPDAAGYLLLTKSFMTRERGQRDAAKKMTEEAMKVLEKGKNKSYLGKAYYELSQYYDCWSAAERSNIMIPLVERAIDAFQQAGNMERKAFSLTMLGDLLNIDNQNIKAIHALKHAASVYDSIHNTKLHGVYVVLGRIYFEEADYRQALQYLLLALKSAETMRDTTMEVCQIYYYLGNVYNRQLQFDLAIKHYKSALKVATQHEHGPSIILSIRAIASSYCVDNKEVMAVKFLESIPEKYIRQGDDEDRLAAMVSFLRAYNGAQMFDKAEPYLDQVVKLADNRNISVIARGDANRVTAGYYMRTKNYPAARMYLAKNKVLDSGMNNYTRLLDLELQYRIDSAQGNFNDAFKYFLRYKYLTDSITSIAKTKQLQQLEVEYETTKKQDSIKLKNQDIVFLTQRNNLQQENLQQARLTRNVTIAVVALAAIIIMLLYRQYWQKQKSNTLITQKNEQLQRYLAEKEWLLKEIHHRVKNNLQTVMSLLNSQSAYIDNGPALSAINDSQHRVHAMALIHQKLYNTENLSSIDIKNYILELVSYLSDSFNTRSRIRFAFDIQSLEMDVSEAVPLGLILNEAITNSIKYAFPNNREGVISISLSNTGFHRYSLSIADNGVGIVSHVQSKQAGSLGMTLMAGLSEDLDGSFSVENNNGTVIKILFVHDMAAMRPVPLASNLASNN